VLFQCKLGSQYTQCQRSRANGSHTLDGLDTGVGSSSNPVLSPLKNAWLPVVTLKSQCIVNSDLRDGEPYIIFNGQCTQCTMY